MRTLVTGGAGFIGSHIVRRLLELGHAVRVLDDFSTGSRDNLAEVSSDVEITAGDVRDADALERVANGCEVIFHEAAIVSVPYSIEHPMESHAVNVVGTLNTLEVARRVGARRVVFASSAAVYGAEPTLPKVESMLPAPISPYGVEKLTCEHYLAAWAHLFGVETVALRYFNVFGPRQDPSSPYSGVISVFVDRLLAGRGVTFFGDGRQTRDFVYAGDVAEANVLAASARGVSGRAYNVACGRETSLLDLATMIGDAVGRPVVRTFEPARVGDIARSSADIGRARDELGYAPAVTVEEGLRRLVAARRA
ncbi:MAG: NAD-dependent epimerase/dehydratase family protein [Myxococcales bacterium]|nr:NAD-dependent epimerase/dehydratase family protein [Myxococcales bacterium]